MAQWQIVLDHLREYGGITSNIAFKKYGITRLSDIVFKLRGKGYVIDTITQSSKNRFGKKVHYALYRLHVAEEIF